MRRGIGARVEQKLETKKAFGQVPNKGLGLPYWSVMIQRMIKTMYAIVYLRNVGKRRKYIQRG
jgi:hypothetical protein